MVLQNILGRRVSCFCRTVQTDQTAWPLKEMIVKIKSVASNRGHVRRIRMDNGTKYVGEDLRNCFTKK